MSGSDFRTDFLYHLPAAVMCEFCRVMDGLTDRDWSRFASEVLTDQTDVRLAERRERRTDWVMNQWQSRNGRVGELLDLLERLQLLRPRDLILSCSSSAKPSSSPPPLPPPSLPPPVSLSLFDPPPKPSDTPTLPSNNGGGGGGEGGVRPLPKPGPPPSSLHTRNHHQAPVVSGGVMCWSYEEVHAGTEGFSPTLQVGQGGFGVVYRARIRNTPLAVKRLKQDSPLDWTLVRQSFRTEVEKLSQFRHPNIVELLGFCESAGCFCIIYNFMENRSLEDQLHAVDSTLSWQQRVGVVEGASRALQFLHAPPQNQPPLIHGDVKSSNILLDRHLEAKLADFGLARVGRPSSGRSATRTASVGRTATVRGTLAYLPDEYVDNGELGPAVDVYSFGVVLLEVLTGRRALEIEKSSKAIYLKDLVLEQDDADPDWRSHLDCRLNPGGAAEPAGCMDLAALACRCLNKRRKKRPAMTEVFDKLQDIHNVLKKTSSCSSTSFSPPLPPPPLHHPPQRFPRPPPSLQSSVEALSRQMSRLGPLEDTYQPLPSSLSSSPSFIPPHPLHSSSSLPPTSSSLTSPASSCSLSFVGPCESDESQGFSQYCSPSQPCGASGKQFPSPSQANGTSPSSASPPSSHQFTQHAPPQPAEAQCGFPPRDTDRRMAPSVSAGSLTGAPVGPARAHGVIQGPDTGGRSRAEPGAEGNPMTQTGNHHRSHQGTFQGSCLGPGSCPAAHQGAHPVDHPGAPPGARQGTGGTPGAYDVPEDPSPAGSLRSSSPGPPVQMNPCKQRFLMKKTLYEEGRIQTPELLSSDDLYAESRGPEESDELDFLPAQITPD
ncbi:interleukin-1 receptor-associated kinase 1 [Myripristis murdjan]|uniref:Interleukin-1 receptor-associated kinase 1 n=1 Tax=Myripristis murdjan TaxID=586833 RepID=A0A667ZYG9_9TELE|nr:interleukin-1 receptor-associated kinase 1-like [Myripristis murdjan]